MGSILALVALSVYMERYYKSIYSNNGLILMACFIVLLVIVAFNLLIREKGRRELQESRDDYQRLLEVSPDGMIVYEKDTIVYVNDAFSQLIKVDKDEIVGKSALELLHPKNYEQNLAKYKEILEGKVTGYVEDKLELANNVSIDVESVNLLTTYKGKKAVMAIVRDISERKRLERDLIEAETKYRSIIEAAILGVFIFQKGKLLYVNQSFEEIFGYDAREIYGIC